MHAQSASPEIDASRIKFILTYCNPGETYRSVYGMVSKEIDLGQDETALHILNMAAAFAREHCPRPEGFENINVNLRQGDPETFTKKDTEDGSEVHGRNYEQKAIKWREYTNRIKERQEREKGAARRAMLREAEAARRKQAAEDEARESALRTETFFKKAGSRQVVQASLFCQNPFPYVGKVIVFSVYGFLPWQWEATSATSARVIMGLCALSMSGIPNNVMTPAFNGEKIVAVKILGKSNGVVLVQYVHHVTCGKNRCDDFPAMK